MYGTEQLVVNDVFERASVYLSVCEMQENNSEISLNSTGLAVLMSRAVKCHCCQIFTEKNYKKQGQAHLNTKKCFVL